MIRKLKVNVKDDSTYDELQKFVKYKDVICSFDGNSSCQKYGIYNVIFNDKIDYSYDMFDFIEKYEVIEINKNDYNKSLSELNNLKIELNENLNNHKYITSNLNKLIESLKEEIAKKDLIIKSNCNEHYKSEIETLANQMFYEFRERFINEEMSYDELCHIYKAKIDAEVNNRIKILDSSENDVEKHLAKISYNSTLERKIKEYKNKIVDSIVETTLSKRGDRYYNLIMHKAGILADKIESFCWSIYTINK